MNRSRCLFAAGALSILAIVPLTARADTIYFDVDGYLDDFSNPANPNVDLGESTATYFGGSLPTTGPLVGPVSTGTVHGQFDLLCNGGVAVCTNPDMSTYWSPVWNMKWAVINATNPNNLSFVSGTGGKTLFDPGFANDGFTSVTLDALTHHLLRFQFKLDGTGVSLTPGSYLFIAIAATDDLSGVDQVPGLPSLNQAGEAYFSSQDDAPYSLHIAFPVNFATGTIAADQVVTSRLFTVVPEPASATLLLFALAGLTLRRRRNAQSGVDC